MFEVTVEDSFSAAHYLAGHKGKCEKLHGHNYRVKVSAAAKELNDQGMVVDFGILKDEIKKNIQKLDHSFLNELEAFSDGRPTAERIAYHIYCRLKDSLPAVQIRKVVVFETEKNSAVFYPDS
jgi:6-pyruvoyltetrahydropterin/6-carboxytetrahydropterin synthase